MNNSILKTVKTSRGGISYLIGQLRNTTQTITRVVLWRIPHSSGEQELNLKIGRYQKVKPSLANPEGEVLGSIKPKSELTLDGPEFANLIKFLEENYEPFKQGQNRYIPIGAELDAETAEQMHQLFADKDSRKIVEFITANKLLPDDVVAALELRKRQAAVDEFAAKLEEDLVEYDWQKWFEDNDWVLGSEFVRVVDERRIDTANIADYLMEAYDGFLDLVEIKRPEGGLRFWADAKDRGNCIPSTDLIKAITQTTNYLYEVQRESNSVKFLERVGVKAIQPRATLIFGRSCDWDEAQKEAYRLLNRSYKDVTILSFDHVLERARRILASKSDPKEGKASTDTGPTASGRS